MNKTIEEEIRTYAQMCSLDEAGYVAVEKAIQFGIDLHKSQPLSQRLTDEERERARKMYKDELEMAQHFHAKAKASNDVSCRQHYYGLREPYISRMKLLQRIFGKELFGEGEG